MLRSSLRLFGAVARSPTTVVAQRVVVPALLQRSRHLATKVIVCGSDEVFDKAKASDDGAVIYFTASWCGPCKMISPVFEELAAAADAKATFLKVDVDDMPEVAAEAQVAAMPTFQFYKKGALLDKIVGADADKLTAYAKAHLP